MKARYDLILWDIDGTLMDFPLVEKEGIFSLFPVFGFGECNEAMLAKYVEINWYYWGLLEEGKIKKDVLLVERFQKWFSLYGLDESKASEFNDAFEEYLKHHFHFNPFALEAVQTLHGLARQVIVTNGCKAVQIAKLALSPLPQYIEKMFISEDIGAEKPSIEFFQTVFDELGNVNKAKTVIIGDSLSSDIQGGINAGITTIYFNKERKPNQTSIHPDYEISSLEEVLPLLLEERKRAE